MKYSSKYGVSTIGGSKKGLTAVSGGALIKEKGNAHVLCTLESKAAVSFMCFSPWGLAPIRLRKHACSSKSSPKSLYSLHRIRHRRKPGFSRDLGTHSRR